MGIYINLDIIPKRISAEAWKAVFADTLQILDYGKLSHLKQAVIDQQSIYCFGLSKREDLHNYDAQSLMVRPAYGWHVTGDMISGDNMEDFCLYEDLEEYTRWVQREDSKEDILISALSDNESIKHQHQQLPIVNVWCGKTQGRRGHLYLLACGCIICYAFPDAAFLSGDISYGQCLRAAEIVKEATGKEIQVPVQFQKEELLHRLSASFRDQDERCYAFLELYHGPRQSLMTFLKAQFPQDCIIRNLSILVKHKELHHAIKDLLLYGSSMTELLLTLTQATEGPRYPLEEVVQELLLSRVHIPEKETYDFTEPRDEDPEPDTIEMMMSRMFAKAAGLQNKNINAYIPLDQMILETQQLFPERTDIPALFYLPGKEPQHIDTKKMEERAIRDDIYQTIMDQSAEREQAWDQYQITRWEDLFMWKSPNDTVLPALWNTVNENVAQIIDYGRQQSQRFRGQPEQIRMQLLIRQGTLEHLLPEDTWVWLRQHLMDDDIYTAYYGLLLIDIRGAKSGDAAKVFQTFAVNKPLFDYCCHINSDLHTDREKS